MIPSVDLIRVKNMLNSTISMSYPDVVIACIGYKVSLESIQSSEAALVKHDNNMKDYSLSGWLITITPVIPNYLVCDRANTQSVTVRKVVKLQLNYCNALVIKWLQYRRCSEGRTRDVHSSSLLIDVYALFSDVSLRRQASNDPGWEIPGPFLLKSDVNLFNHLVRKADVARFVVLRVLFFVDMRLPRIQCRWFVLSEVVFYVKLMQIN